MTEKHPSGFPVVPLRERPHLVDQRTRPRVTVQVIDGKICCEFTPAERPAPQIKR
jgi:hypothetical protein